MTRRMDRTLDCAGSGKAYTRDYERERENKARAQSALDTIRRLDREDDHQALVRRINTGIYMTDEETKRQMQRDDFLDKRTSDQAPRPGRKYENDQQAWNDRQEARQAFIDKRSNK